jgi:uncharacterized protein (DUF58 family)
VSARERQPFPLVPRWRLTGLPFGEQTSVRRGPGSDVAGSREYVPGDPIGSIDWYASARLSAARGREQFVVREHFEDEAPRVVVVCDRRPSMALYDRSLPWLSKPDAVAAVVDAIVVSTLVARGEVGYIDEGGSAERGGRPYWLPPRSGRGRWAIADRVASAGEWDAPPDTLARSLEDLLRVRAALPGGSFVFLVSDFAGPLPAAELVRAAAMHWDVVPVVVRDPVWEQSFPELHSVVLPFVDVTTGQVEETRLRRGEARARRRANEAEFRGLLDELVRLDLEPVVIGTSDPAAIDRELLAWADQRKRTRRRRR